MSEFQHYQFKAVDRPLTREERSDVGSWSSRSRVTATNAAFTYHYSDFKKDPLEVVEHYFDLMLYFSNWGARRLIVRLPINEADLNILNGYIFDNEYDSNYIYVVKGEDYVLIDICQVDDDDGGIWTEEDDFSVDNFVSVRTEMLKGNFHALYLLWIHFALMLPKGEDMRSDRRAVPQEPGTNSTSGMHDLLTFFEITL